MNAGEFVARLVHRAATLAILPRHLARRRLELGLELLVADLERAIAARDPARAQALAAGVS